MVNINLNVMHLALAFYRYTGALMKHCRKATLIWLYIYCVKNCFVRCINSGEHRYVAVNPAINYAIFMQLYVQAYQDCFLVVF